MTWGLACNLKYFSNKKEEIKGKEKQMKQIWQKLDNFWIWETNIYISQITDMILFLFILKVFIIKANFLIESTTQILTKYTISYIKQKVLFSWNATIPSFCESPMFSE